MSEPAERPTEAATCRVCGKEIRTADLTCVHCGAPRPARADFTGEGYEFRSAATCLGYPMIHIAFGMDADGRPRIARGLLAIGQRARGGLAVGIVATGFIAVGFVALGVFSLGIVAVAAGVAIGANAAAPCAIGVAALGYWSGGLVAWGRQILFTHL